MLYITAIKYHGEEKTNATRLLPEQAFDGFHIIPIAHVSVIVSTKARARERESERARERESERESERARARARERERERRGQCVCVQCCYVCFVPQESGDKMEAI